MTAEVEAEAAELAAQGGVGTTARTAARQQLYQAALKREVKALVDEVMPQIEINSAQEDDEVVVLLLRQLGYPTELQAEVFAAWRAAVNEFRQRLATAERNVGALRLYAETASMAQAREELPDDLHDAAALVNATLSHFELGASANQSGVINELLQELDLDADDLADGVRATVEAAATAHLAHRAAERTRQLDEATKALKEATALDARTAELLVPPILKLLDATCGDATAGAAGDADGDDGAVEAALEAASGLSCAAVPPLRAAVRTHCAGQRRQAAREAALEAFRSLISYDALQDDRVFPPEGDGDGAAAARRRGAAAVVVGGRGRVRRQNLRRLRGAGARDDRGRAAPRCAADGADAGGCAAQGGARLARGGGEGVPGRPQGRGGRRRRAGAGRGGARRRRPTTAMRACCSGGGRRRWASLAT